MHLFLPAMIGQTTSTNHVMMCMDLIVCPNFSVAFLLEEVSWWAQSFLQQHRMLPMIIVVFMLHSLLEVFDSGNDPTYTPDVGKPYLYYYIGNSSSDYNWNGVNNDGAALPASGNDTVGCSEEKSSDGIKSVELFISVTNLILAVVALSFLY